MYDLNVLILEDNELAMTDIVRKLSKQVFKKGIYETRNYEEATQVVASTSLDIAFVDLSMPKQNGMDFLVALQQEPNFSNIPIVITTAVSPHSVLIPAIKELVLGILYKPVNPNELVPFLQDCICKS